MPSFFSYVVSIRLRRAAWLIGLVWGCEVADPQPIPQKCVVARSDGYELTAEYVLRIRQEYTPSPPLEDSAALALDIVTAEWISMRTLGQLSPGDAIDNYREFVERRLAATKPSVLLDELRTARREIALVNVARADSCPWK